jgi:hypothetical protein
MSNDESTLLAGSRQVCLPTLLAHPSLDRRRFLKLTASGAAAATLPSLLMGSQQPKRLSEIQAFNYVIGTIAVGATYQFTKENLLVEMARAILDLGSNTLKFTMGRGYQRMMLKATRAAYPETMQYLLNQGSDAKNTLRIKFPGAAIEAPPVNPAIGTLTELAQLEPCYRQVFAMPFAYYLIWTYAFTPRWWHRGFATEDAQKEYREIYDLVVHLLKSWNGTGKTFFLGHAEGDWLLRPDLNAKSDASVTSEAIEGMIAWLNARQKAVDDAKRDTPHHEVQVFHYTEVNRVSAIAMEGRPSVANRVLPRTQVDYVSYSTYDSLGDIQNKLSRALSYLESKLPSKPGLAGKRVFIGEYGFPAHSVPEQERARKARQVMRVGLEWGCPFILCWQMYNNEFENGHENGFWLVDDKKVKQPLWHTHYDFLRESRRYVAGFKRQQKRLPAFDEFRSFGLAWLDQFEKQSPARK